MTPEQIHKTERVLLEKQNKRLNIIDGLEVGDKEKARADYYRTVAWVSRMGLGKHLNCNAVDPDFSQTVSDAYKDVHGFRPRGMTYAEALKTWQALSLRYSPISS